MNVTPKSVSARVVKTRTAPSEPITLRVSGAKGNEISQPSLRPIQFACIVFTRSGHPGNSLSAPSSSSA